MGDKPIALFYVREDIAYIYAIMREIFALKKAAPGEELLFLCQEVSSLPEGNLP